MAPMMVTIDRAGRVVIPKDVRERLDIDANASLELTVEGDSLRLTPARVLGRRVVEVDGWPVIEAIRGLTVTDADVQRWRDDSQR